MLRMTRVICALGVIALLQSSVSGSEKTDIWFTLLSSELGDALPRGSGVHVSQVESPNSSGHYTPSPSDPQFTGKTFFPKSGITGGNSSHARGVGRRFYGNSSSIARDISTIDNWEANHWATDGFLNTSSTLEPGVEIRAVQNHSWIGTFGDSVADTDAIRRFDYTINRDNYVAVAGMNNGDSMTLPSLMGHSYNAISVGRSDGNHSHGMTTLDTAGRIKPDIVAPLSLTSHTTPYVGGAAAMLLEEGAGTQAENSEAIKSILLAGATKHEFSDWDRTSARPLDDVYGAGELNVYRSYHILDAGEQESSRTANVGQIGWDFEIAPTSNDDLYFFNVAENDTLHELSVVLTWNRIVTDGLGGAAWGNPQSTLADLSLELWSANSFSLDARLDFSNSRVDNVEHIYQQQLEPGQYAIRVLGAAGTDFALAWSGTDYSTMGDLNLDGFVTGDGTGPIETDDLSAFIAGWGRTHSAANVEAWRQGDLNLDGTTDLYDFALLRSVYPAAAGIASALTVPEPSSVGIAVLIAVALAVASSRRVRRCDS